MKGGSAEETLAKLREVLLEAGGDAEEGSTSSESKLGVVVASAFDAFIVGVITVVVMDITMQVASWTRSVKRGAHHGVREFQKFVLKLLPMALLFLVVEEEKHRLRNALVEFMWPDLHNMWSVFDAHPTGMPRLTFRLLVTCFFGVGGGILLGTFLYRKEQQNRAAIRRDLEVAGWTNEPQYQEGDGEAAFYNVYSAPEDANVETLRDWEMF